MELPNWHRAHGPPLFDAVLRQHPSDFCVTEELGWSPSGDGEHDYLWVQKAGANTDWVLRQLAAFAQVAPRDCGFAGLKDRHAVTRQWFSVPRWHKPDWAMFGAEGVEVLDVRRHLRKLRRGAHAANRFEILLRLARDQRVQDLDSRVASIRALGVPNYYGEQRFGRGGGNLKLAEDWARGSRLPRHKRSLAISTIRSYLFNQALSARVGAGSWDQLLVGDFANLDGSGSVFNVTEVDAVLRQRCVRKDIHPALELAGKGSGIQPDSWQGALDRARVEPASRSLRLLVHDFECHQDSNGIRLAFVLQRGAFATAVLRELCRWSG